MEGTTGNRKVDSALFSMKFLWDSARILQTYSYDNRNLGIIMHHLRERCMVLSRNQVTDSSSVFKKTEVCTSCGNCYSDGKYKLKVLPHKQKMKLLKEKLLQKPEEVKSKYNKYLSSFFSMRKDNVLVKQCKVCKKVSKLGLTKPILKAEEDTSVTPNENLLIESKGKRKRKKSKKDRFSGLDPSAVTSARMSRGWRDSLHSPSYTDESSSACLKEDSDVCSDPSNNSLIESIKLKEYNILDDNSNTSLEWNGNTSFLSDKSFISERKQCNYDSKKIKKQKSSIMSNSFINFNDKSVSNKEINLKSPEHFSPQLNNSVTLLKQNYIDLNKSGIRQVSNKRSKINKKDKKKKKSDLSNFLSQLYSI